VLALALAACHDRDRTPAPAPAPEAAADDTPAEATSPTAPADDTGAPAPEGASDTTADAGPARFDGYGPLSFGMTEAEAVAAWDGKLNGVTEAGQEGACHYLNPANGQVPAYRAFMFEGGRFVRYDVGNDEDVAPGGGRRGMDESALEALYPGRITRSPHKYVDGGEYLRVAAPQGEGELVFETDAKGRVTEWRAGIAPQVGYIEGCS
jgi:hypothetical protein